MTLRLGISADVPLAVQQWQGIVAVNYPARAFGVKRSDNVREAREKCPNIQFVHVATFTANSPPAYYPSPSQNTHKVSLDEYRRASRRIMDVVKRLCPTMRKASIDEAYLDASGIVNEQILRDFDSGTLQWSEASGQTDRGVLPSPVVQWTGGSRKGKEREGSMVLGVLVGEQLDCSSGWGDLQLRYAAAFAKHVRDTLFQELGYRSSAGISHTKCLAKIGSGLNKPSQQTIIRQSQIASFLSDYPITSIPSLGGKLGALLETAFDAQSAGDLMHYTVDQLAIKLGPAQAQHVFDLCRGIDDSPVIENTAPQTLTSAKNFQRYPVRNMQSLDRWISMNATDLWMRVTDEWDTRKRWPQSLTVSYTSERLPMRSRTVGFPPRQQQGGGAVRAPVEALADAARACLRKVASEPATFPMVSFMLTAKAFRKELASASLMERWLSSKTQRGGKDEDGTELDRLDAEDQDEDEGDDEYQPQPWPLSQSRDSTRNQDFSHIQEQPQVLASAPAPAPISAQANLTDRGAFHPSVPMLSSISAGDDMLLLTPGCASEYDTTDSDLSCLKTPHESESDECVSEDTSASAPASAPDETAALVAISSTAAAGTTGPAPTTADPNAQPAGRHLAEHGPPSRSTTVSSRRRAGVYIQSSADLESAARYGEGYKHMNIDRHDDGSLVVASPDESQADGFIPALIAATRRKREIQIIRFQHAVDAPEGAIAGTSHAPPPQQHSPAGTQGADPQFIESIRDKLQQQQQQQQQTEEASSSDESNDDLVLDIAVNAMMESLSSSQSVMQIRCPQCPENSPPVSSQEWETHRDWHIARQLQERELRHESVAKQIQKAFGGAAGEVARQRAAKKPRHEGEPGASSGGGSEEMKRRQKTISEAWK
ncbi:N-acetyltransferase eso1 [Coemansia erecta]|uniref:N-acetyltransferase eso1 n=1 Tax=Coemansia erecta TaxID=147472 RepID=A0A9W7Y1U2_9FUNG|nr:N-acetyltransferase eso1 [Coemansia erecta]